MKELLRNTLLLMGVSVFSIAQTYGQCNQFNQVDLGNDTILCPGDKLEFDLSGLQNNPTITWDNGSQSAKRTVNSAGIYSVGVKYLSNNLIVNGDFENGNVDFSTDYTVGQGGQWGLLSSPGTYAVSSSPSNVHNNFSNCGDHTGGGGNMLVVNGSGTPGISVWCQTVNVSPDTDYEFSTWISNALSEVNVAQLQFTINGNTIGNVFTTSIYGCDWNQFFEVWNSGTNTTAELCITNLNTIDAGNDFAIDDISFSPVCVYYDEIEVVYNSFPTFTLPSTYNACEGATVELNAENLGFNYNWSTDSDSQNEHITESGIYTVEVSDDGYCEESRDFEVIFHEAPSAGPDRSFEFCNTELSIDLNEIIDPSVALHGLWYNPQNIEIIDGQLTVTGLSGVHTYKYVVSSTYCTPDTANYELDIKTFKSAGEDAFEHFCNENSVIMSDFLSDSKLGEWTSIDGLDINSFNPATSELTLDNLNKSVYTFEYIVTNDVPCPADTAYANIEISEIADIQFAASAFEGCSPLSVDFTDLTEVNGTKDFTWFIEGEEVGQSNSLSAVFEDVHCYDITLEITTDDFCTASLTQSNLICVNPDPIADFSFSPTAIFSDDPKVDFENLSYLNHMNEWDFDGLGQSTDTNPSFLFPLGNEGDYVVGLKVTSEKGCVDSTYQTISIKDQTLFYVPNAFTPDGDERNNTFLPVMTVGVDPSEYTIKVYSRWGECVFESHDLEYGWDKAYGGKIAPDGVYIWTMRFKEVNSTNIITQKEHVVLIR